MFLNNNYVYKFQFLMTNFKMTLKYDWLGPKMCTTLAKHGNLSGNEACGSVDNVTGEFIDGTVWHSCEEWCLSKVNLKS